MVNNSSNESHSTTVQVIHDDGSWANGIRSLFIYGTGALRYSLLKAGGTPSSRAFIIVSTIGAETVTRAITNAINDPNYVKAHIDNWKTIWDGKSDSAKIYVEGDIEISKMIDKVGQSSDLLVPTKKVAESVSNVASNTNLSPNGGNKFISDGNSIAELFNNILSYIMNIFRPILEPVKVNYSNELLANQLNDISIMLFILSIFIIILLLAFMVNIIFFIYSDKISNYFTNKYIKWYINFNKKIIGIELIFLGSSLLYFMYILSYGIHFLATHPILFN